MHSIRVHNQSFGSDSVVVALRIVAFPQRIQISRGRFKEEVDVAYDLLASQGSVTQRLTVDKLMVSLRASTAGSHGLPFLIPLNPLMSYPFLLHASTASRSIRKRKEGGRRTADVCRFQTPELLALFHLLCFCRRARGLMRPSLTSSASLG